MLYKKQSHYLAKFKIAMVNIKRTNNLFTLSNSNAVKVIETKIIIFVPQETQTKTRRC